jgi:hypothetical protein
LRWITGRVTLIALGRLLVALLRWIALGVALGRLVTSLPCWLPWNRVGAVCLGWLLM